LKLRPFRPPMGLAIKENKFDTGSGTNQRSQRVTANRSDTDGLSQLQPLSVMMMTSRRVP